ncbi:hypothetical protein [Halorubrum distributum]|uniref:hypothetical protein n=1 Tax=Halorubrum distributum TaxID=29283 RepID=UPI0012670BE7|nr:hypothetical protein [Halorubrum litoreum]
MDIPGTEKEYKKELTSILSQKYSPSEFDIQKFSHVSQKTHSKMLGTRYEFVGLMDDRSITPESLQDSLPEFQKEVKKHLTTWQYTSFQPYLNVVGVTDEITTATRDYLSEGPPESHIECPFSIYVVDVKSGGYLEYNWQKFSSEGGDFNEYIIQPLD